ncbi:hypothetical protein NTG1052_350058 [Candidatus Nitrotoga sp. 1052]|nr:hypothetical protein NTG1052_350058 [Candidatus Nitrotoga sp. 1052]
MELIGGNGVSVGLTFPLYILSELRESHTAGYFLLCANVNPGLRMYLEVQVDYAL